MALSTYQELQDSIASWLMRDDLTAAIPSFIALCEAGLNRRLRLRSMLKTVTVTAGEDGTADLPADFLEGKRLELDGVEMPFLVPGQTGGYGEAWRGTRLSWWSVVGEKIQFVPAPSVSGGTVTLLYYGRLTPLSEANPTSRVLTEAPDVMLYGSLSHSAPFLQDDARIAVWDTLYTAAVDALQAKDREAQYPGPLVIRSSEW